MKKVAIPHNGNEMHYRHFNRRQWHKALVARKRLNKFCARQALVYNAFSKHMPRWRQITKAQHEEGIGIKRYEVNRHGK